jgi:tRNA dimethylallyltransferase
VDLATRYNGEIINGDAMQMYKGAPIITNKVTVEEMQGVPHHLLGVIGQEEEPWTVGVFKKKASKVIKEIRSRGKLPILVGGTHYYTQSLLFEERLVADEPGTENDESHGLSQEEIARRFPILERPNEEILEKLREVDPIMAERWHYNDRRKIQRSLEIYLMSGKRASDIYAEQRERKAIQDENPQADSQAPLLQSTLLFWVNAERETLKARLDKRVEKMIQGGLIDEVKHLSHFLQNQIASGNTVDQSRGIWVSIGFKEFQPYLTAVADQQSTQKDIERSLKESIESTKASTRQYSNSQVRWIRLKLLTALFRANALENLFLMDGTDISRWEQDVMNPAIQICHNFLKGNELPAPRSLSPMAEELLAPKRAFDLSDRPDLWKRYVCELCNTTTVIEEQWQAHLKSRTHRRHLRKANKPLRKNASLHDHEDNSDNLEPLPPSEEIKS